jgi:hypothetical protein
MRQAATRFLCVFWASALAFAALYLGEAAWLQPLNGDLTRIGHWPERDYGWNATNPPVQPLPNALRADTNLVVLGDSFSELNLWQSFLQQARPDVRAVTFDYNDICPEQLPQLLDAQGLQISKLVLETVENSFIYRFDGALCSRALHPEQLLPRQFPLDARYGARRPRHLRQAPQDLEWMLATNLNLLRLALWPRRDVVGYTANVQLARSDLFSSDRPGRLLFLGGDLVRAGWSPSDLDRAAAALHQLQAQLAARGVALQVVVVPDKSTAYRHQFDYARLVGAPIDWAAFFARQHLPAIDLERDFTRSIDAGAVDFYLPNDTHLSLQGYRHMAANIAAALDHAPPPALEPMVASPAAP